MNPRVREGLALARHAHAMLDTSDGIADASRLLAAASRVRLVVEERWLPLAPGVRRVAATDRARRRLAFYGGDYELLAAVPPDRIARAMRAVRAVRGRLTVVGRVERGAGALLRTPRETLPMPPPDGGRSTFQEPRRRPRRVILVSVRRRHKEFATLK